jgi:hypothetical protein
VVINCAVGAPARLFALAIAPVPEAPLNAATVIDDTTLCDNVACTVAFDNASGADARQISAVPLCALVRATGVHVSPAPVTDFTAVLRRTDNPSR